MLLGREIHDPMRSVEFAHFGDKHLAGTNLPGLARGRILAEVLCETFLEHKSNAFAHYAHRIDGINQHLGVGFQ